MTTIFLLNGTTSFPNPGNWDPVNNKVECLGSGGNGAPGHVIPHLVDAPVPLANTAAGGGGGGGYGFATALNPTFPVAVNVGNFGSVLANDTTNSTWWVNSNSSSGTVLGFNGANGLLGDVQGGAGGSFFPAGFNGGTGGNGIGDSGGGAGGAAGPNGGGGNGFPPGGPEPPIGGLGGAAMSNLPGGGYGGTSGAAGGAGTFWDASHGPGGGGGGGTGTIAGPMPGGAGGSYGGAGGGGGATSSPIGQGKPGLMVITYTPFIPPRGSVTYMA